MSNQSLITLEKIMNMGAGDGLVLLSTEDATMNGRTVIIDGQERINFGSCSYLGLEMHENLKQGVIDAVTKYGTQFSSSRAYLSIGLYDQLEALLEQMFQKPVIATPSTTLGHFSAMPTLIGDNDAIVMDMQVHSSIQLASQVLKARGIPVTIIRHNDMEALEKKIVELSGRHDKVWYMADGVYSMYGDYAPFAELENLMNRYAKFHMYVDDAHGMSWKGENGTGVVRSQMAHHDKMVLAVSLNKAFASSGGCLVFPNTEMRDLVRKCGSTMIFSGPIQPPMLGAAIESAKLHLSPDFAAHQAKCQELYNHTNLRLNEAGLPQFMETESPLFFVPAGLPRVTLNLLKRMTNEGFHMNSAGFPATPMKRGGARFTVNNALTKADIDNMVDAMQFHYPRVLEEEGLTPQSVARTFGIKEFKIRTHASNVQKTQKNTALKPEVHSSIHEIDQQDWDATFADRGNLSHSSLSQLEEVFSQSIQPENNWKFTYFTVKDEAGNKVLSTFFTCTKSKEDMFAPASVSEQVEARRKFEPDFLTAKVVSLGAPITKGDHLFLDRNHPEWKRALQMLVDAMQKEMDEQGASQMLMRDFYGEQSDEMTRLMLNLGLSPVKLPNNCSVDNLNWNSEEEFAQTLTSRYRSDLRREILRHKDNFELVSEKPQTEAEIRECYDLYSAVFDKSFELNVYKLPYEFFKMMAKSENYDILRMYLKDDPRKERKAVAAMFSFAGQSIYNALIVGLDYEFVRSHQTYKQILYRTVLRANELGAKQLDLAFTAELVKKKVGAVTKETWVYAQVEDHFNFQIMESMARGTKAS